jgi:hypothetical protein
VPVWAASPVELGPYSGIPEDRRSGQSARHYRSSLAEPGIRRRRYPLGVLPQAQSSVSNPIAPHHASWAWGAVSFLVLFLMIAVVVALVWLFFSHLSHLREHREIRRTS